MRRETFHQQLLFWCECTRIVYLRYEFVVHLITLKIIIKTRKLWRRLAIAPY